MSPRYRGSLWLALALALVLVSLCPVILAIPSDPFTISADASTDTYLSSAAPNDAMGSASELWVTSHQASQNWTLVAFDPTVLVKADDRVLHADMRLSVARSDAGSWPVSIFTGRILTEWRELAATWNTAPGVGCEANTVTVLDAPIVRGTIIAIDVTTLLRHWQALGPSQDFGMVIRMFGNTTEASLAFASRENVLLKEPRLEITTQAGLPAAFWSTFSVLGNVAPKVCPR